MTFTLSSGVSPTFDALFDDYVASRTEDREQDSRYHPSSLYFCDRRVVYDQRLTPREPTSGSKRPLLVGKVLHEQMQAALEHAVGKSIRTLYVEGRVDDPDTGILGNFDALYQFMDGTWELWEGKTANANSFRLTKKSGEAKADHSNQALSYVHVIRTKGFLFPELEQVNDGEYITVYSKHPPIPELSRARVTYLDKSSHETFERVYVYTQQWGDDLVSHIDRLNRYKASDALPPRLPAGSWQCGNENGMGKWCPFWDRCQNTDTEGVEL